MYLGSPRSNKEATVSAGKIARKVGGDERSYTGLDHFDEAAPAPHPLCFTVNER